MIEELTGYFSEDYYKEQDEKIVEAMKDYEEGRALPGEEGIQLKEKARRELESQLVSSGQAEADTVFINPEEFFPEGQRDEEKIEEFRREMTRSHAGQQMLWSFAGTTGSFTVLTEKQLESFGRDLDSLKPAALRRQDAQKKTKPTPGTVPLYLYGDGSSSQTYQKSKAKLSFDRCRDKSGFNWNQREYDPNYSVEKQGWFGGLNQEEVWEAVETASAPGDPSIPGQSAPKREIELINTLDGALIFDTALLLCGPEEEEYYYNLDGELYGAVKTDRAATVARLKESLKGEAPVGIVLPGGVDEATRKTYDDLLVELGGRKEDATAKGAKRREEREKGERDITPRVFLETEEGWQTLLAEDRVQRDELEQATLTLGAATRLRQSGVEEEAIEEFLSEDIASIEVPLNPFVEADRAILLAESLSSVEKEKQETIKTSVDSWFDEKAREIGAEEMVHVLPSLLAALPVLVVALENGVGSEAVLDEAFNLGTSTLSPEETPAPSPASKVTFNGRVTLEELSRGMTPWGASKTASLTPDFFREESRTQTAQTAGLKEGEILSLAEAVERLNMPPMDRKEFNKRMASALSHYRTVQTSTGMTVSDLVSTVDSITMKRPDAKRLGSKDIYFEESLGELLAKGRTTEIPTKTVNREELFQPVLAEVPAVGEFFQTPEIVSSTDSYLEVLPTLNHASTLSLTEGLLAAFAQPVEEAQPLSERQLSGLIKLYESVGATQETAQAAVDQWQQARFTPEEYKAVRNNLKKKLQNEAAKRKRVMSESTLASTTTAGNTPVLNNPLELTDKLLTTLAMNPSPEAQPLRQAEIADLDRVYRHAGTQQEAIRTALKKWEQVKFTPEEFKAVRDNLEKQLKPVSAIKAGNEALSASSIPGHRGAGDINSVLAASQFTPEEKKAVQAVMEAYRAEESHGSSSSIANMNHPMSNEALMPLVSQALAGQWGWVPASVRPMMSRAVGRTSRAGKSFSTPTRPSINSQRTIQTILSEAQREVAHSSFPVGHTSTASSLQPVTRQLPVEKAPALAFRNAYKKLGYRVNPQRGQNLPIHTQSAGTALAGVMPSQASSFEGNSFIPPAVAQVLRKELGALSGIRTTPQAPVKPTVQAVVQKDSYNSAHNMAHPIMGGAAGMTGFNGGQGFPGQPGGMAMGNISHENPFASHGNSIPGMPPGMTANKSLPGNSSNPLSRMERINQNYEQDKASLGQGEQRMLARSESHSVGHAGGNRQFDSIESERRLSSELLIEMKEDFDLSEA
ncbi:MAG: hypothetical protein PQJ59_10380 [Spirochaetales bacterium]|nr:hypothetical protein [Spirochaetales bacterium]